MNDGISRLLADLLGQAKGGEDLSSGINRVRTAIKKVIEAEDTMLGKLSALVGSFQEVIPDEQQRYQIAVKALCATSRFSRQEIAAELNNQLQDVKILEKHLISALPAGSIELNATEARSQELRSEIARLREKIVRLEKEEKEIANSLAARAKESAVIEKAMREVFAEIGAEITAVVKNLEGPRIESDGQQPSPVIELETEHLQGSRPNPLQEDGEKDHAPSRSREIVTDSIFPDLTPVQGPEAGAKAEQTPTPEQATVHEHKQKCSMCGGRMDYYSAYGKWQCYSCGFEYRESEVREKKESQGDREARRVRSSTPNALFAIPLSESLFDSPAAKPTPGYWGPKKGSAFPNRMPAVAKTCPSCGEKMQAFGAGKGWQCNYCGYERRI